MGRPSPCVARALSPTGIFHGGPRSSTIIDSAVYLFDSTELKAAAILQAAMSSAVVVAFEKAVESY